MRPFLPRHTTPGLFALAASAAVAQGAIFFESEPNSSIATSDFLGSITTPGGGFVVDGTLTPGDVDWFSFEFQQDATLFLSQLGSIDVANDGQFQLVDATGTDVIAFDDDSGPGFLPALNEIDLPAGLYYLGVSAFPDASVASIGSDELFDGLDANGAPHNADFAYKISIAVNLIPGPGSVGVLAIAGAFGLRRRRTA